MTPLTNLPWSALTAASAAASPSGVYEKCTIPAPRSRSDDDSNDVAAAVFASADDEEEEKEEGSEVEASVAPPLPSSEALPG